MNILGDVNFAQLFVPDAAKMWKNLWEGFNATGLFGIILGLGWVLLGIGFIITIYQMAISGNAGVLAGPGLRVLIGGALLSIYPTLRGTTNDNGAMWRAYHGIYALTYGDASAKNSTQVSFYSSYVAPKIAGQFEALKVSYMRLGLLSASIVGLKGIMNAVATPVKAVDGLTKIPGMDKLAGAGGVAGTAVYAAARGAAGIGEEVFKNLDATLQELNGRLVSAQRNLFLVLIGLAGFHALITYGTIVALALVTFFYPIVIGLWIFKAFERGLPTVTGILLSILIVIPLSGIMLGTTAVMVFSISAERITDSLPDTQDFSWLTAATNGAATEAQQAENNVRDRIAEMRNNAATLQQMLSAWTLACNQDSSGNPICTDANKTYNDAKNTFGSLPTPPNLIDLWRLSSSSKTLGDQNHQETVSVPTVEKYKTLTNIGDSTANQLDGYIKEIIAAADRLDAEIGPKKITFLQELSDKMSSWIVNTMGKIILTVMVVTTVTLVLSGLMIALSLFAVTKVLNLANDFNLGSGIHGGMLPLPFG